MISTIKFLIISLLSAIGIRHFNQELYTDVIQNPTQYILSFSAGFLTYLNIPLESGVGMITGEFIKMVFAVITAVFVIIISFVIRKILDPLWEQKLKPALFKAFKLK